jgi:cytosine/adenosine deaminase-related metal-dependent hydrolase
MARAEVTPSDDPFEAAYTAGVVEPADPPAPGDGAQEVLVRAALREAFALKGCVLTPDRAIEDGYVVVGDGRTIKTVTEAKPDGVPVRETDGVILPGMIDLHGHPEFNVFAAWEPPRRFPNRYAWRGSTIYKQLVREPQDRLLKAVPPKTQLRYAEIRALVGGVTAIQGTGGQATSYQDEALVRNVDKWIFGEHRARSMIDLPSGSRGMPELEKILAGIADGSVAAFYIHLAEGRSDNQRSVDEFDTLVALDALTAKTVVIHGTALTPAQLGAMKDAGAKLVWSPQSNLRLYGETTKAAEAMKLGLPVGLGADWLPSGSTSLLAELKVARRCLADQGARPTAKTLVQMVTSTAAEIAGLSDKLGKLAAGRPADLTVLERRHADPWENVVEADPSWVELVLIDGDLAYGRADWVREMAGDGALGQTEELIAWGKQMRLDASYSVLAPGATPPKLEQLRADLIGAYPQVGPIFA